MPEYLAPGVYVEEVSFRSRVIEGVATTTTAFVGPTRYGPLYDAPEVLTSLPEFERVYGDGQRLEFGDLGATDNYMWQAVRAFFTEGGGGPLHEHHARQRQRRQRADRGRVRGDVRDDDSKTGLVGFEDIDDVSIVAAPGATAHTSWARQNATGARRSSTR
jgi:hypothetical protein